MSALSSRTPSPPGSSAPTRPATANTNIATSSCLCGSDSSGMAKEKGRTFVRPLNFGIREFSVHHFPRHHAFDRLFDARKERLYRGESGLTPACNQGGCHQSLVPALENQARRRIEHALGSRFAHRQRGSPECQDANICTALDHIKKRRLRPWQVRDCQIDCCINSQTQCDSYTVISPRYAEAVLKHQEKHQQATLHQADAMLNHSQGCLQLRGLLSVCG